jgi:ABC-2 type transport system ATP-binding protein
VDVPAISTLGLTMYYGKSLGIRDMDLEVRQGEVFGLLGPNGAGKTTTIRLLMDYLRPSSGSATVLGLDVRVDSVEIRRRVGHVSADLAMYSDLTASQIFALVSAMRSGLDHQYLGELIERFELDPSRQLRDLSRGNLQKVALVQAFAHRPSLLILDEPTSGLDPIMQQEFHSLVQEVRSSGATVFVSSHNLPEVETICDRVGIIKAGELAAVEEIASMKNRALRHILIHFDSPVSPNEFRNLNGVTSVVEEARGLRLTVVGPPDEVVKAAARHTVVGFTSVEPSLEEMFLDFYGRGSRDDR